MICILLTAFICYCIAECTISTLLSISGKNILQILSFCLQRFQKCENAKIKLFQTEGRGWGLIADEDIMVVVKYKS